MQSITQSSGIHCKVATQNEVRRFFFPGSDYASLLNLVCQVCGLSKDSAVIKYADDEGDFVTVSSDEEVKFALDVAKGLLRLRVDQKLPPKIPVCSKPPVVSPNEIPKVHASDDEDDDTEDTEDSESSGGKPKWRKRDSYFSENPQALERCLQRLKHKRQKIQEKLVYLESAADNGNLGKGKHRHREKLRGKVAKISSRIDALSAIADKRVADTCPGSVQPLLFSPQQTGTPAPVPVEPAATTAMITCPGPSSLPKKEDIIVEIEKLQANIVGLKLTLRTANLQLQLHRTNLQAATHRRNAGEVPSDQTQPQLPPEEIQQLKDALCTAKANQATAKAELKTQVRKLQNLVQQLKAIKQSEKAEWKAKKGQEKVARKAEKIAKRNSCANMPVPQQPFVQDVHDSL